MNDIVRGAAGAALLLLLGGCGSVEVVKALDHGVTHEYLNAQTIEIKADHYDARALRAQFIIVGLARDAKRSIEFLSDDPASDAARLAARIQVAEVAVERIVDAARNKGVLFNLGRADIMDEAIEVAKVGATPTVRGLRALAYHANAAQVAETAVKALRESLERGVYKQAYIADLKNAYADYSNGGSPKATWKAINERLQAACNDLAAMVSSNAKYDCVPASLKGKTET